MEALLQIDDDVFAAAEDIAAVEKKSVGAVISELSRKGLSPEGPAYTIRNGIPVLNARPGVVVTMEMVNKLRDELP
jgi:hypothetical protein